MTRRTFITHTATIGALGFLPAHTEEPAVPSAKYALYDIIWRFDLSHHAGQTSLWIPLPSDIEGFQHVVKLGWNSDASECFETARNRDGARTLYALWEKNAAAKTLNLRFTVALRDRRCDFRPRRICSEAIKEAQAFLAPSAHLPTDGAVASVAAAIVAREKEPLTKARRIYDWIVANSYRDESVMGCGIGSPNAMLAALEKEGRMGGKCLDMSALCVALMRASGIPAREVTGVRVGPSRFSSAFGAGEEITKAQHCKVEFFTPQHGWIPCDPADITKLVLKEGIEKTSPRARELTDLFFGFWENNWMALNHARDFDLYPANAQGVLDTFGYPYGEVEGEYLDPFGPASYRYAIRSTKGTL